MGKPGSSCFKIISCGNYSTEEEEIKGTQGKSSADKSGWSFRKRSARHRVLSNTVISELPPPAGNKESLESTSHEFAEQVTVSVSEKIYVPPIVTETNPKPPIETNPKPSIVDEKNPTSVIPKSADGFDGNGKIGTIESSSPLESVVIVIQAAIRGYLAQRELLKQKNVVKLQAAIRGHLVRRQAAGTLRCVQAIIKLQALVRARRVRMSKEGVAIQMKLEEKRKNDVVRVNSSEEGLGGLGGNGAIGSADGVFGNGFTRQLLESAPKTKPIHIDCDPSRSSSAWNWLERWMAASTQELGQSKKPCHNQELNEKASKQDYTGPEAPRLICSGLEAPKPNHETLVKPTVNSIVQLEAKSADSSTFSENQARDPVVVSNKTSDLPVEDAPLLNNMGFIEESENSVQVCKALRDSLACKMGIQSDETSTSVLDSVPDKPRAEEPENPKRTMKRAAPEPLDTENKRLVSMSRRTRSTSPSFAAVQSKFEELSSTPTSVKPVPTISTSRPESPPSQACSDTKSTTDIALTDDSTSYISILPNETFESSSQITLSPALPRNETEGWEALEDAKSVNDGYAEVVSKSENLDNEASNPPSISNSPAPTVLVEPVKIDGIDDKFDGSETNQFTPNINTQVSDLQNSYNSSPEGSPISTATAPESLGTPLSQISSRGQNSGKESSGRGTYKGRSLVGKKSPVNQAANGSNARNSVDHQPTDTKSGRRRSSFGSTKLEHDNVEHELRSSPTVPGYMQATESARAKALTSSPKSSPDVQDKANYHTVKRHSLPGSGGRTNSSGSPRIQRSLSQAQPGSKGKSQGTAEKAEWRR